MVTLSVLDQSPVRAGGTAAQALQETLALAEVCERLGYARYWVAEHHNSGGLAGASPEILIGQIAARTHSIRVGSGGVMLSHYSPLKVAEQFRMLEAFYPGRIDLGIGRAPGSDGKTAGILAYGRQFGSDIFTDQVVDLQAFLTDEFPEGHPFRGVRASPRVESVPELWLLGSTWHSAGLAAELGWSFSFAQFISPDGGEDVIRTYRRTFCPSPMLPSPRASIGVSVTCAETEEEAERLSWSRWAWRAAGQRLGGRGGIPTPEEAQALLFTAQDREYIEYMKSRSVYGNPEQVKAKLLALGERYDVDEFVVVTITYDFAARVRSYELLAEAFGLTPPPAGRDDPTPTLSSPASG